MAQGAGHARRPTLAGVLGLLLVCRSGAGWGAEAAPLPLLSLALQLQGLPLNEQVGVLRDDSGTLGITDVRAPAAQARFQPATGAIQAGFGQPPFWFKLRLHQDTPGGAWVLALLTSSQQASALRFYGPYDEAGIALAPPLLSDSAALRAPRFVGQERQSFLIAAPEPGIYTVYLRAQAQLPQRYVFTLSALGEFAQARADRRLFESGCYGLMLGLMVFASMLGWAFRDTIYGYFLLSLGLAQATLVLLNGQLPQTLSDVLAQPGARLPLALAAVWTGFGLLFGRRFLSLRRHRPRLAVLTLVLVRLSALAALMALAGALWHPLC